MQTFRTVIARAASLWRRRQLDADLNDEVGTHLELLTDEYVRRGLTRQQARLAARRAFGGVEQMKETYRDGRGLRWLDDARRDIHHALRSLRRAPVFAGAAVLTLAVGLTAVTSIFAVLNAFMFRPLPVSHPEELVSIGTGPDTHVQIPHGVSFRDLQDYRKDRASFVDLLGYNVEVGGLTVDNTTDRITMYSVTDNYFTLLGVQPAIGRLIQPNEGRSRGDAPVLVLTHAVLARQVWRRFVGRRPPRSTERQAVHHHRRDGAILRQGAFSHHSVGVHAALDARRCSWRIRQTTRLSRDAVSISSGCWGG